MVWFLDGYRAQCCKVTGVDVQVLGNSKPYVQYRFCVFARLRRNMCLRQKKN